MTTLLCLWMPSENLVCRNFFWYFTVVTMKYQWGPVMMSQRFSFWTVDLFFLYLNMLSLKKNTYMCTIIWLFHTVSRGVFRNQLLFCGNTERFLDVNYFCKKSFIVDVRLGSKYVFGWDCWKGKCIESNWEDVFSSATCFWYYEKSSRFWIIFKFQFITLKTHT